MIKPTSVEIGIPIGLNYSRREIEEGEWLTFHPLYFPVKRTSFTLEPETGWVKIPLHKGKIIATLDYDGEIQPVDVDVHAKKDFPPNNPLFNSSNLLSEKPYVFCAEYREPEFKQNCRLSSTEVKLTGHNKALAEICDLFTSLEGRLSQLYSYARDTMYFMPGNPVNNFELIQFELNNAGYITGNCQTASTFVVGLAKGMGLEARRILGYAYHVLDYAAATRKLTSELELLMAAEPDNGHEHRVEEILRILDTRVPGDTLQVGGGHIWPEILVPDSGWMLMDCSLGFWKNYPAGDGLYYAVAALPRLSDHAIPARIKVEFA